MNKRVFLIFALVFIPIAVFPAELEIKAGLQMLSMKDFDAKITAINNTLLLAGGTAKTDQSTGCFGVDIAYGQKLGESLRVGPRVKFVPGVSFTANYFYPDGTKSTDYTSSVFLLFAGTGAAYNFMFGDKFGVYAGLDAGYQFGFGSNKITYYDSAGAVSDTKNESTSANGFGYYIRGGAKYFFSPDLAMLLELNYNNVGENLYAGTGISFSIFEKAKPAAAGGYQDILRQANSFFGAKDYAKASGFYMEALKIKKEAGVYKYLGHCFYFLRAFAKARWCYDRAVELSGDAQLRALSAKLKGAGY